MKSQSGSLGWGPILGGLTGLTMALSLYLMFIYAPADAVQGNAQRIFYIHVPMAWDAYLAFFVVFVAGIGYLWKRSAFWDQLGRASAEIGLVLTTLVLISGSLWGRPIWGTWWTWDARLTTTLILWFMYLGYFMLRAYAGERERAARFAAVLGIVAFVDVPINYLSVQWWRTLHPTEVVSLEHAAMPGSMLLTLMVSLLAFTLLYVFLLRQKWAIEQAKDRLIDYQLAEYERQAQGEAQRAVPGQAQPQQAQVKEGVSLG
ncbi:MAG TPA: cytochrome c biogenesis protein CcsA [Thermomicrobiaceae bacterium]|nr:cytochrome c biogenesis protein CcsA [Thermomicrobiaceae bacterium]